MSYVPEPGSDVGGIYQVDLFSGIIIPSSTSRAYGSWLRFLFGPVLLALERVIRGGYSHPLASHCYLPGSYNTSYALVSR